MLPRVSMTLSGTGSITYSVRNSCTTGVQNSPKLLAMVDYVERGKAISLPCATLGRSTVRQTVGEVVLKCRKKQPLKLANAVLSHTDRE